MSDSWWGRLSRGIVMKVILVLLAVGALVYARAEARKADENLQSYLAARDSFHIARDSLLQTRGVVLVLVATVDSLIEATPEPEIRYETITRIIRVGPGPEPETPARDSTVVDSLAILVLDSVPYGVPMEVARFAEKCIALRAGCAELGDSVSVLLARIDDFVQAADTVVDRADVIAKPPAKIPLLGIPWKTIAPDFAVGFGVTYNVLSCEETTSTTVTNVNDFPVADTETTLCPSRLAVGPTLGVVWTF